MLQVAVKLDSDHQSGSMTVLLISCRVNSSCCAKLRDATATRLLLESGGRIIIRIVWWLPVVDGVAGTLAEARRVAGGRPSARV